MPRIVPLFQSPPTYTPPALPPIHQSGVLLNPPFSLADFRTKFPSRWSLLSASTALFSCMLFFFAGFLPDSDLPHQFRISVSISFFNTFKPPPASPESTVRRRRSILLFCRCVSPPSFLYGVTPGVFFSCSFTFQLCLPFLSFVPATPHAASPVVYPLGFINSPPGFFLPKNYP